MPREASPTARFSVLDLVSHVLQGVGESGAAFAITSRVWHYLPCSAPVALQAYIIQGTCIKHHLGWAANDRYLDFLSALDGPCDGQRLLPQLGTARKKDGRSFRGFNLFTHADLEPVLALLHGEGCISGITNRRLRRVRTGKTSAQISYFLKRCRVFRLRRQCGKIDKYSLAKRGRRVLLAARQLQEFLLIPTLAGQQNA